MKFSTKTRYALRLIPDLAKRSSLKKGAISLKELAQSQQVSEKYSEQIFGILRRAGLVISIRGSQGGYELARSPDEITLAEIIRCTEGDLAPVSCLENGGNGCSNADRCPTIKFWRSYHETVSNFLNQVKLSELADGCSILDGIPEFGGCSDIPLEYHI